ncbi:phosphatidate cytidylyltransferase [Treponema sp. OMZ 305]|uniref:diacylglycerol/polyprenol kinase family protein n=1 Tax=Treponema sp. OMZ 305 TaxID=1659192 RepID=UPI0020A4594A|nr:diacylglycerol/polyprenol kinase family protein [Treponema sp. OMZ 305]UTC57691.1 phosphatidate cytidylyltransferase [Treponema sp. OMZ 305]
MKWFERFRYRTFSQDPSVEELLVEVFRKAIHLSSALTVVFAERWYTLTIVGIAAISVLYCISEFFRMHGYELGIIAHITRYASRKRDKGRFVLGPLTLAGGVLAALQLFPMHTAKIAIFALAFGDGLASLVGKRFGKIHLAFFKDKTVAGSLTCFAAVFLSSLAVSGNFGKSLVLGIVGACIEMLPLKDYDNLLIPVAIGFLALLIRA